MLHFLGVACWSGTTSTGAVPELAVPGPPVDTGGETDADSDTSPDTGDPPPPEFVGIEERASYRFVGDYVQHYTGQPVAMADLDGDGRADLIFGAQGEFTETQCAIGEMAVVLAVDLDASQPEVYLLAEASYRIHGAYSECLGFAAAGVGDVDGDGKEDLVLGAPNLPNGYDGHAYLLPGGLLGDAYATWYGTPDDELGRNVGAAGDVDGDGLDDVLLGAPHWETYGDGTDEFDGAVYLLTASDMGPGLHDVTTSTLTIRPREDYARIIGSGAQGTAGDLDGDGLSDVFATDLWLSHSNAEYFVGAIHFFLSASIDGVGAVGADSADVTIRGEATQGHFGMSASVTDDIDGDGVADFVAGAHVNPPDGGPEYGGIYFWRASTLLASAANGAEIRSSSADVRGEWRNVLVTYVGDIDGGGRGDYALGYGALADDTAEGRVRLLPGEDLPTSGTFHEPEMGLLFRQPAGDYAGFGFAGIRDVDGDGRSDLLVGIPSLLQGKGITYLLFGS